VSLTSSPLIQRFHKLVSMNSIPKIFQTPIKAILWLIIELQKLRATTWRAIQAMGNKEVPSEHL